jgi:CHASE2 domain-containing sensor protein
LQRVRRSGALWAAVISAACGLLLWQLNLGTPLVDASYDSLFRFQNRSVTNRVALVLMDNAARANLNEGKSTWPRALHAKLLDKLSADHCPLVVFDVHFEEALDPATDQALANAMRKQGRIVLMSKMTGPVDAGLEIAQVLTPHALFLNAATNWGVGQVDVEWGHVVRRHWPFPSPRLPASYPSLAWTAAELMGARLPQQEVEQWLRYYGDSYGERAAWGSYSYHIALDKEPGFFSNTVVWVGKQPEHKDDPSAKEPDKYLTPYTAMNGQAVGGVEILATTYLNLLNEDWLRRAPWWLEALVLMASGAALGLLATQLRPWGAYGFAVATVLVFTLGSIVLTLQSNYWFPWLLVVIGQVPPALVCRWVLLRNALPAAVPPVPAVPAPTPQPLIPPVEAGQPSAPDYTFVAPPFGKGTFGKVWLVRNAVGQWQALKAVYRASFDSDRPYDVEWNGICQYKPLSGEHPALLRVDFVSAKNSLGWFYYVMELGDAQSTEWEQKPELYRPRDLGWVRKQAPNQRLPVLECINIGLALADALEFLHGKGLIHRDIKPSNIIFVRGRPKLADVGLVTRARAPQDVTSYVGTPDYMPPLPESPGTVPADIYALGMVLFVISSGTEPAFYPHLKTTLVMSGHSSEFMRLNAVILKACHFDVAQRYPSASALRVALQEVEAELRQGETVAAESKGAPNTPPPFGPA